MTIDTDGRNRVVSYVNLQVSKAALDRLRAKDIRIDRTRKGYHSVAYVSGHAPVLVLRHICGDDANRLYLDSERLRGKGGALASSVLWSVKRGFHVEKDVNPDSDFNFATVFLSCGFLKSYYLSKRPYKQHPRKIHLSCQEPANTLNLWRR